MGLDMYLQGEKVFHDRPHRMKHEKKSETYDLGYWRKHPNLHGFIVEHFADGEDNCQAIELSVECLKTIIEAIEANALPVTTGFFFGVSDGSEKESDLIIFREALEWSTTEEAGVWRGVQYRASW